VGRLARRFQQMTRDVTAREAALHEEIAALRAEIDRARAGTVRELASSPSDAGSRTTSLSEEGR
jgi:hypothetical protein